MSKRAIIRSWREPIRRLFKEPMGMLGFTLVVIVVMSAVLAPALCPHDPNKINIQHRLESPSADYPLGTDQLGRDVFSRILMGGRIALWVALVSVSMALGIGLLTGTLAAYGPQWLDNAFLLIFDVMRSFPTIMFALALVTVVGPSLNTVIIVVVATTFPVYGRMVRTQAQVIKNREFIEASKARGAGLARIMFVHTLPNIIGPLLIIASMDIPVVVTIEAGLSFLGVGVKPPTPSWGSILNDGYSYIRNTPWIVLFGGLPLIITTLGFTFLGETLRDIFDPKLRRDA
jgi:peptide/nickel transport system permease protein